MGYERFTEWAPRSENNKILLVQSTRIIAEYAQQGYQLTLRQLYYQMVARDIIPNSIKWYNKLGDVVTHGRMAGYIDWGAIVDRGRTPVMPSQWDNPADILSAAASSYRLDRWQGQPHHVEVWCEKDALSGVIEPVCRRYHVRFLANRGYSSSTAMYDAAKRFEDAWDLDRSTVVIYLGDHDPSGLDMTRDVADRLHTMTHGLEIQVQRLALNHDQVLDHQPPPNPTKMSDSRARDYVAHYGTESWELDALEPQILDTLISNSIEDHMDLGLYDSMLEREELDKLAILRAAEIISQEQQDPC